MAKKLLLIRHGVTSYNLEKRYIGETDEPLAPEGERQAASLVPAIHSFAPGKVIASPKKRTVSTARIATSGTGLEVYTDDDLREMAFGEWEGLAFEEIKERYPDLTPRFFAWNEELAFPGGESIKSFMIRVKRAAARLTEEPEETVAVFTHGGVIRLLICLYLNIPPDRFFSFRVTPGSITSVELFDGKASLAGLWRPGDFEV